MTNFRPHVAIENLKQSNSEVMSAYRSPKTSSTFEICDFKICYEIHIGDPLGPLSLVTCNLNHLSWWSAIFVLFGLVYTVDPRFCVFNKLRFTLLEFGLGQQLLQTKHFGRKSPGSTLSENHCSTRHRHVGQCALSFFYCVVATRNQNIIELVRYTGIRCCQNEMWHSLHGPCSREQWCIWVIAY